MRNSKNGWTIHEAGMAQVDDIVGVVMQKLKDMGVDDNTIVMFTTDNGTENFTWPDGGQTPFFGGKGTGYEGGFRVPCHASLARPCAGRTRCENGIISGLDWFPTFVAAAGNPNIKEELAKGKKIGDRTYKNYLDGYNQMDMITGKGPSARHEVFYFTESNLAAVRIDDFKYRFILPAPRLARHQGSSRRCRFSSTSAWTPSSARAGRKTGLSVGSQEYFDWFKYEFWRFVLVQQEVGKLAITAIEYPPMQKGASFNLDAVKAKIAEAMKAQQQ